MRMQYISACVLAGFIHQVVILPAGAPSTTSQKHTSLISLAWSTTGGREIQVNMTEKYTSYHEDRDLEIDTKLRELTLLKANGQGAVNYHSNAVNCDSTTSSAGSKPTANGTLRGALSPTRIGDHVRRDPDIAVSGLTDAYKSILDHMGEDSGRQGLLKTPERAAKALLYFTKGYDEKIAGMI